VSVALVGILRIVQRIEFGIVPWIDEAKVQGCAREGPLLERIEPPF
jgi:hypothetical protein